MEEINQEVGEENPEESINYHSGKKNGEDGKTR
jgi:hypothetical protein